MNHEQLYKDIVIKYNNQEYESITNTYERELWVVSSSLSKCEPIMIYIYYTVGLAYEHQKKYDKAYNVLKAVAGLGKEEATNHYRVIARAKIRMSIIKTNIKDLESSWYDVESAKKIIRNSSNVDSRIMYECIEAQHYLTQTAFTIVVGRENQMKAIHDQLKEWKQFHHISPDYILQTRRNVTQLYRMKYEKREKMINKAKIVNNYLANAPIVTVYVGIIFMIIDLLLYEFNVGQVHNIHVRTNAKGVLLIALYSCHLYLTPEWFIEKFGFAGPLLAFAIYGVVLKYISKYSREQIEKYDRRMNDQIAEEVSIFFGE
jgi:tetratricopeptide (TPR) repeat protein